MRALDLISAMVTRHSLQTLVQHLLSHLTRDIPASAPAAVDTLHQIAAGERPTISSPAMSNAYRLDVARRIIAMCSKDLYDNVEDFEWYLSVLVDLAYVAGPEIGETIKDQMLDIVARVRSVRPFAVRLMTKVVGDESVTDPSDEKSYEVLWAAAWICGEYCR